MIKVKSRKTRSHEKPYKVKRSKNGPVIPFQLLYFPRFSTWRMQLLLDFSSLRGAFLVFPHAGDSGAEEFSVFCIFRDDDDDDDDDDVDIYVHGNFCTGWGGVGLIIITFNRLRSLLIRLALPKVISNTFLLLRYEHKNEHFHTLMILPFGTPTSNFQHALASTLWTERFTRSGCYVVALLVISNTLELLRNEHENILLRSWCYVAALPTVISNTLLLIRYLKKRIF